MNKVSFLDLKGQHKSIKNEVFKSFEDVYKDTAFSGGKYVEKFENDFAEFCNSKYALGVNSGTSALHLALLALGIKSGDEVIIPSNTFIATAWAVSYVGAKLVFVDCDSETWEIDVNQIENKITKKTVAIIGVHLYGQPFDVDKLKSICDRYNLYLVEDAAQAHGANYKGKKVGSLSDIACFSFYPGKNLGACGEGGGITTDNEDYYNKILSLRNHGTKQRYYHDELGFNMRMGGFEAASLKIKLKYIDTWNLKRKEIAKIYQNNLDTSKFNLQYQPEYSDSVYHLFVITVDNRDELIKYLNEKNIFPGLHYPIPCHLQKAYNHLNYSKGDFPNSEYLANHCLSLPMYAELSSEDISYTIDILNRY